MNLDYTKYLGVPYIYGGDSLQGLDCINLCVKIGEDRGIKIPNINHSHCTFKTYHGLFDIRNNASDWEAVKASPDTLVVFKVSGKIGHVGYMLDNRRFIHILKGSRVTIEKIDAPMWDKRIIGFYKYIGD